ncbi:hypothetical protein ACFWXH_07565 [Mesorhizobium sp. NPDC059054]
MFENEMWLLLLTVGPIVLAGVIAFALLTRRRKSPAEQREQDAATRRLYR